MPKVPMSVIRGMKLRDEKETPAQRRKHGKEEKGEYPRKVSMPPKGRR